MAEPHQPGGAWDRMLHERFPATRQAESDDPRPFKIYRVGRNGRVAWHQRWAEAWWCLTGKHTLHRVWQAGRDDGTRAEYRRTVIMGGR